MRSEITVVGLSVCLCHSVCVCVDACSGTTGYEAGLLVLPSASELRKPEKEDSDFPETTAFERYAVKTSEKANMHNC